MPQWITKSPSLRYYYDQLGDAGDFDPGEYDSNEDAAGDLGAHTNFNNMRAMELVEELLNGCGRIEKTKEDYEALVRSTTYVSWWTSGAERDRRKVQGETPNDLVRSHTVKANRRRKVTLTSAVRKWQAAFKPPASHNARSCRTRSISSFSIDRISDRFSSDSGR
jgi:hypothetical protein